MVDSAKAQRIGMFGFAAVVGNHILSVAFGKDVGVGFAAAAVQAVVARSAGQGVAARSAGQGVMTITTGENIISISAF